MALQEAYDLTLATNAHDALALAEETTYDIILLDISLGPSLSGIDLMHALRDLPQYRHTPIVAMSAEIFGANEAEYIEKGFNKFLAKPFFLEDLFGVLADLLP